MAISDFLGQLGVDIGGDTVSKATNLGVGLIYFVIMGIAVAIATAWWVNRKSYNKTIHIFEEVSSQTEPIEMDKAKEITLPFTSVRAFYLKKKKIYLPRPSLQTGKGHYWFFIREDGEWMNIKPSNVNEKLRELNLKFDHTDMRMANASLKKLVEKNYKKTNWLKEYAPYIGFAILILMLGIVAFLVVGESSKVVGGINANIDNMEGITANLERILSASDRIASTSGIRSAT